MDQVDLGVLKALLVNNGVPPGVPILRKSLRSIAKDLGVDQSTVRSRIRRFRDQGVLKGWRLGTNPGTKGQHVGQVWLRVRRESDKGSMINVLLSSKEIERVCNYFGPTLSFVFLFDGENAPQPIIERLLKDLGPAVRVLRQGVIPVPKRALKDTDILIIGSLQKDPWKPYARVAEEVRASPKTVARRMAKMSEEGAIYMLPVVDLKMLQGIIPAELVVEFSSPESRSDANAQIVARIGQRLVFSDTGSPYGYFALLVENLSQLEQLAEWCTERRGVQGIRVGALQDVILSKKHYQDPLK